MHKVSIKNETDNDIRPRYVFIDGQRVRAVSVNFNQSVDTVPTCNIEVRALPDIEALANIQFQFTRQTLSEAARVLRNAFLTDAVLYDAFVSSIAGVLKELPEESDLQCMAKAVADRIIGRE